MPVKEADQYQGLESALLQTKIKMPIFLNAMVITLWQYCFC